MSKHSQAKSKGQLLSFNPTGEYYFTKGLKAFQRRDFHKAVKYLQRAMQLEPGEPMIVCQLAIIYTEISEYHKSNELLHFILEELDENMMECHYFLANNYAHLGYFKDAYSHVTLYLESDEDGEFIMEAEELMDVLMLEAESFPEDVYEQDDLIMMQEKARDLLDSGQFPKAVELLKSLIEKFPEYWSAYNNLALSYFYLGEIQKANDMLDLVMERNPGNLHAICNKLVFAHAQKDFSEVKLIKKCLLKIRPILIEHQFKLGVTYALVGDYELAYCWFTKLSKRGYEGDGTFYYWFSYAAYHTGREKFAQTLWRKVLKLQPEKDGLEPWNHEKQSIELEPDLEVRDTLILEQLQSEYIEERLFAFFLLSLSEHKKSLLSSEAVIKNNKFSKLESEYVSILKTDDDHESNSLMVAHETAKLLYKHHHPIGKMEAGLYLLWFSVFVEMVNAKEKMRNEKALAAAMEYVWSKLRNQKCSQKQVAHLYGLSSSTLQKYIKLINHYLH